MSLKQARAAVRWSYAKAKREAEARVVRWEWATFARYSLEPCYFEIHKFRRGDLLKRNKPVRGAHGHGFDARGQLCVERQNTEFRGRYYETFYAHRDDGVVRRHFDYSPDKRAINTAFFELEKERVVRIDTIYTTNTRAETFTYDTRGRLASVKVAQRDGHDFRDLVWDAAGLARVYWRYPNGKRVIHWERPKPEDTLAARRAYLKEHLARAIRRTLEKDPPEANAYAVALWWCEAEYQHRFPPNLAVGTTLERDRFVAERNVRAIWSPAEWDRELIVATDRSLQRVCDAVNQDVWQNDLQAEADALLVSIAADLEPPIATTNDVVTYAVELDAPKTVREQLSKQISSARRAALKKRKLL